MSHNGNNGYRFVRARLKNATGDFSIMVLPLLLTYQVQWRLVRSSAKPRSKPPTGRGRPRRPENAPLPPRRDSSKLEFVRLSVIVFVFVDFRNPPLILREEEEEKKKRYRGSLRSGPPTLSSFPLCSSVRMFVSWLRLIKNFPIAA